MSEKSEKKQSEKFADAARALGCNEDEARFEESLRKIVKHERRADDNSSQSSKKKKEIDNELG